MLARPYELPKNQYLQRRFLHTARNNFESIFGSQGVISYLGSARSGIYHSLNALHIPPDAAVLIPSYICRAAVAPIETYGCRIAYYNVHRDCSADLSDLGQKIRNAGAVLVVHYFGFPQNMTEIQRLCNASGVRMIEDCAHLLLSRFEGKPLGSFGDASVFSWRKQLPILNGATLIVRSGSGPSTQAVRRDTLIGNVKSIINLLQESVAEGGGLVPQWSGALAQRMITLLKTCVVPTRARSELMTVDDAGSDFVDQMIAAPMTRISRWVYDHSDFTGIIQCRRSNYEKLAGALINEKRVLLAFPTLSEGTCPYVLPLFLEGVRNAQLKLRALRIPAATWGGVRPASLRRGDFPEADFLYDNLVFLPVHQSLRLEHFDKMIKAVKTVMSAN
jgi:perosamine synthetase